MKSKNDINAYPVSGPQWSSITNDSDDKEKRKFPSVKASAGEWTRLWFTYTNSAVDNVNRVDLYDQSNFGLVNETSKPVEIKIRKVKGELSAYPTSYRLASEDR